MTLPAVLLGLLIASLYGLVYHVVRDGRLTRLLYYLGLSWAGFSIGILIGWWRGWTLLAAGALDIGLGTLGSLVFLGLGDWLSRIEVGPGSGV
jgi:hypothetical protein